MNPKRLGVRGCRFTGSTDDSGPEKPVNSVKDKTLTIRKISPGVPISSFGHGKPWTRSDRDTTEEST